MAHLVKNDRWNASARKPYIYTEHRDRTGHFWFDKQFITDMTWAGMSSASQTIYPAIASHFNKFGDACPGQIRIASLCGITRKTVADGINGLSEMLTVSKRVTAHGKCAYKYKRKYSGRNRFPFYNTILHGGNWYHLTSSARALYPVMRVFGYFNYDEACLHSEMYEDEFGETEFREYFAGRKWDMCSADDDVLFDYAGISRRRLNEARDSLSRLGMIEEVEDGWLVYLRPTVYYKHTRMNELVEKKLGYDIGE